MTDITLAIDPGTHRTGAALFEGEDLKWARLIEPPKGLEVEERVAHIIETLDTIAGFIGRLDTVVLEQATGMEGHQPAPELQTLIRRIRRWARRKPRRAKAYIYHPSTIYSAIRFRQHSGPRKEQIKLASWPCIPASFPMTRRKT